MNRRKTKLKLTDFECNLLWGGMNEFRNKACSDGIPTEDVDELLLKIINQSEHRGMRCIFGGREYKKAALYGRL